MFLNIACGSTYVRNPDWVNLDYTPAAAHVRKANLLDKLPLEDESVDVVYCSHFIEHIPKKLIVGFLLECKRVLKKGGYIRFVLPDFEEMCKVYLANKARGDERKAEFIVLEILDQCVRAQSSGELGEFYRRIRNESANDEMISYVFERTGEVIDKSMVSISKSNGILSVLKEPKMLLESLERLYCRFVTKLLPSAFYMQNVSFTQIGEKHTWVYDYYSVSQLLSKTGFQSINKMTCDSSNIIDFPLYPLDLLENGVARKGNESMYIEAVNL